MQNTAPFYRLTAGENEYRLKLTTATKIDAEKRLGFSLLNAIDKIDYAETFAIILWAALQKYHANMPMPKVYNLIDELENEGCTIDKKADIVLEIMKVSGFFTAEQIAEMEKAEQIAE